MPSRTRKLRGSRTHGRGHKRGRGAGMRGGRGNAGLHKHKYTWVLKYDPNHFGRHGFKSHRKTKYEKIINICDLHKFKMENNFIDLSAMGYDKLLGKGKIDFPVKVKVKKASHKAIEKIKSANGEVLGV